MLRAASAEGRRPAHLPFSSRMVAYLLLAKGQELRLHSPVTLYSFLQKFWLLVLALKLQCSWLMTWRQKDCCGQFEVLGQETVPSTLHLPDNFIVLHAES